MKLHLLSNPSHKGATLGRLTADGVYVCDTLEDVVRETPGRPVSEWKRHGVTAIPAGTYEVVLQNSPRFGPDTITLLNVPGFEFIRGHGGNTAEHTEGCLLFGTKNTAYSLANSQKALAKVKALVKSALDRKERVQITIERTFVGA